MTDTPGTKPSKTTVSAGNNRRRLVAAFALVGAVSGAISYGLLLGAAETFGKLEVDLGWSVLSPISLLPGLVFGIIVGAALYRRGLSGGGRAAAYVLASTVSYFAAVTLAIYIIRPLDDFALAGLFAGLLGATCLTAATAGLFPFVRRRRPIALMITAGALLGLLLRLWGADWLIWGGLELGPLALYAPWQAGYAAALATALPLKNER